MTYVTQKIMGEMYPTMSHDFIFHFLLVWSHPIETRSPSVKWIFWHGTPNSEKRMWPFGMWNLRAVICLEFLNSCHLMEEIPVFQNDFPGNKGSRSHIPRILKVVLGWKNFHHFLSGILVIVLLEFWVHPWKLTYPLKNDGWKMYFLLK